MMPVTFLAKNNISILTLDFNLANILDSKRQFYIEIRSR